MYKHAHVWRCQICFIYLFIYF
uniref:Uncharacterized protein n=1 Tax=Anguilla anguilla TaxID=7936 RepID=A0A0E9P691_ANGAN